MECKATHLPYGQTNQFSSLVVDYVSQSGALSSFYQFPVSDKGLESAMGSRNQFPVKRDLLIETFRRTYKDIPLHPSQEVNLQSLSKSSTFTICTAHQPNLFTGYLYFIYKIAHAIKLASYLKEKNPGNHFVPVFFMGAEDNDLEELNRVKIEGMEYVWHTSQSGAVGRMKVDTKLLELIEKMEGQIGVFPYGPEIIQMLKSSYTEGRTISEATLYLVNYLFASYGLLVLLPDDGALKSVMLNVFEDDLLSHTPHELVSERIQVLDQTYKVQVNPREINLFYLKDDIRERITGNSTLFSVPSLGVQFEKEQILEELRNYPERFSPNVVLRGLFQEMILPNIAFIGGGSEIAYWLEFKSLFEYYKVPLPVLVLRNSFLLVNCEQEKTIEQLELNLEDLFKSDHELMNLIVKRDSSNTLSLESQRIETEKIYKQLKEIAGQVDRTLVGHIGALEAETLKGLDNLEKKLVKAEKKKFDVQKRKLDKIREELFPGEGLQERSENFIPFYARYGKEVLDLVFEYSPVLEQEFTILTGF